MKTKYLTVLLYVVFALYGCTKEEENSEDPMDGAWHVIGVSGGFIGLDDNYDKGVIVWTFNTKDETLVVQNNNDAGGTYDGLASGNYTYSVLDSNGKSYLIVDNIEWGGIVLKQNEMVIDQNMMSTGSGADRYVLKLTK